MNQKTFGATITKLRKRSSMTQSSLAKALNVSDKAISKWETGMGYPEITLLPKIAAAFGVTIDYLITGERRGIAIAGNVLTDIVKNIDTYPDVGMLSSVQSVTKSVGGCVPNITIDLTKIDPSIPISAIGCVGDDENGRYVLSQMQRRNIDTTRVRTTDAAPTGFSDVMSLPTGERTIFNAKGTNAFFAPEDIDTTGLTCNMLHIGAILNLERFDVPDPEYGTALARFLATVQNAGIRTSIDLVSDVTADYPGKIIPVLKYCDYMIVNEIECCSIWGLAPRHKNGALNVDAIREAMGRSVEAGVSTLVIVHCKEAGFCMNRQGGFTVVPSLQIPLSRIKGSVGAGDAYCAGCLYAIYNHYAEQEILEFASAAAACSLFAENAVDSMYSKHELQRLMQQYPRKKLAME